MSRSKGPQFKALKPISLEDRNKDRRSNILQEVGVYEDVVKLKEYLDEHAKMPQDGLRIDLSPYLVPKEPTKDENGKKVYGSDYRGKPNGPLADYTNPITSFLWRLRNILIEERRKGLIRISNHGPLIDIWDAERYKRRT